MSSRILLVDDDILLREVIEDYLVSAGYEVDVVSNCAQALELFQPGKYGLAILDQDIKRINGLKLMRLLRLRDKRVICLIMTGYPSLKAVSARMQEGISDYIIKPFSKQDLLQSVRKYV